MTETELLQLIKQAKRENWTELDLSGLELTSLPPALGELRQLTVLKLGWNEKTNRRNDLRALPDWLAQLTNLQSLDLSGNKLTTLPDWLAHLTRLQSLDLSNNKLTALPDGLVQLTTLQSLDLSYNDLTVLLDWLAQFTNLQSLNLSNNKLTALPDWLAQITNLRSLYLNNNKLTALPDGLTQLTNLQLLYLGNNDLTALPDGLAQLTNLRLLYLGHNDLTTLPDGLAQLANLQSLSLGANKLTTLTSWLGQLTHLQSLDLHDNDLTALPDGLAQLTNLQSLDLSANKLTTLADWLGQLTHLQLLDLSDNYLMTLPDGLAQLTNLQLLDLSLNNLTALPDWLRQLTHLQSLDLAGNNLTALPDGLAQLTNFQSLDLSGNNLTELPPWLAEAKNLPQLQTLRVGKNPLTVPPAEILGEALTNLYTDADIEAIRSYFRQLQAASVVYFYEAKLLIIGEGGAGKTSLAHKLLNPACQLPSADKSTQGIDILTWQFPLPPQMGDDNYQVNIWDFGGQEIYFATHQFFLTKRSVYLLVADTRRHHTDFYNWLRMQETFGGESVVLLVKNHNRHQGASFTIDNLPHLRERFPNLKEIIELDLQEVPDHPGWRDLLHHLQTYLLRLDHIGQPRPATWVAVRQAIDNESREVITWGEFVSLCGAQGMKGEDDMQLLGQYLHNLGDILYFHEDAVLCDYVILKPTWGLDAVYQVLDNPQVSQQLGRFNRQELRQLWRAPHYQGYQTQLLRLMENFQLCYPLAAVADTFIAPQLLSEEPPAYTWDGNDNLQVRYVYPLFMPRGVLSRAIVKLHRRIEAQRLVWRAGVILCDEFARAEVLELRGDQQLRIRVSGRNKRDLLMEIIRALDELHLGLPKLQVERRIPCTCAACLQQAEPHFYALEKLRERLAHRKETIECQNPPYHEVAIRSLLDEFGDLRRPEWGRGDRWGSIDEALATRPIVVNQIDTGGGAYIGGNADVGGNFVGRDQQ